MIRCIKEPIHDRRIALAASCGVYKNVSLHDFDCRRHGPLDDRAYPRCIGPGARTKARWERRTRRRPGRPSRSAATSGRRRPPGADGASGANGPSRSFDGTARAVPPGTAHGCSGAPSAPHGSAVPTVSADRHAVRALGARFARRDPRRTPSAGHSAAPAVRAVARGVRHRRRQKSAPSAVAVAQPSEPLRATRNAHAAKPRAA